MEAGRSDTMSLGRLDRSEVLELARQPAEPAVTIAMPIPQPAAAHPEIGLRRRALVERALERVAAECGAAAADAVAAQLDRPDLQLDPRTEPSHGVVALASPDDGRLLRLPFSVSEQVVVSRTYATRQLFEVLARHPRYRVLVLDGHDAGLYEGFGHRLVETSDHGFPLHVEPPHEWDTPQRDLPIREEAGREERRFVYRAVADALRAATKAEALPVVVCATEREQSLFEEVGNHGSLVIGAVTGNHATTAPSALAAAVDPVLHAHRERERAQAVDRLVDARGRGQAVVGLDAVRTAAEEGRGHLLVLEEGFPELRNGAADPEGAGAEEVDLDDLVDDVIEAVLLRGGDVEFVAEGALADCDGIGLLLRY